MCECACVRACVCVCYVGKVVVESGWMAAAATAPAAALPGDGGQLPLTPFPAARPEWSDPLAVEVVETIRAAATRIRELDIDPLLDAGDKSLIHDIARLSVVGKPKPLFVLQTDVVENIIYVGQGEDHMGLYSAGLLISKEEAHWVRPSMKHFVLKSNDLFLLCVRIYL